jgi:osmotically-inducible protein OsmY
MTSKASNRNLRQHVLDELDWDPKLDADPIGVAVQDGIATLSGHVPSFAQKRAAEQAALRVAGVQGVANEIDVHLPTDRQRTDAEIAQAAVQAITWNALVPDEAVKVKVDDGWLTLNGTVGWNFQRKQAERAVRNLIGVRGVSNLIEVEPSAKPTEIHAQIKRALERRADAEAERITVKTKGGRVTLEGTVGSWGEREDAEDAAWAAPGVTDVDNNLTVSSSTYA